MVKTVDGRTIELSLSLNMARSFSTQTNISFLAGDAKLKDPLVLNFNGTSLSWMTPNFISIWMLTEKKADLLFNLGQWFSGP